MISVPRTFISSNTTCIYFVFFSVNRLRQVVKQLICFYSKNIVSIYKKHNEHVSTSYPYQIGAFNRGFVVQIVSNCKHFD